MGRSVRGELQDLCPALCVGMVLAWAGGMSHTSAWEWVSSFLTSHPRVLWQFAARHTWFLLTGTPTSLVKNSPSGPGELASLPELPEHRRSL